MPKSEGVVYQVYHIRRAEGIWSYLRKGVINFFGALIGPLVVYLLIRRR